MKFLLLLMFLGSANISFARGTVQSLERSAKTKALSRINPILERLCSRNCEIVDINVDVQEKVSNGEDMGFETAVEGLRARELEVRNIRLELQIDSRITAENKDRLERIIKLNLKPVSLNAEVIWSEVMLPRIGGRKGSLSMIKSELDSRLRRSIEKVFGRYCPDQCILEQMAISGQVITLDQSRALTRKRVVRGQSGDMNMRVDSVDIDITMDESLSEEQREKISQVLKARTRFIEPIEFNINVTPFPETYLSMREKEKMSQKDPYGLDKLRQMLVMFRELAGTKEIITNSETSNSLDRRSESSSENSQFKRFDQTSESSFDSITAEEMVAYIAGLILLLTLMGIALLKFNKANKAANEMILASPMPSSGGSGHGYQPSMGDSFARGGADKQSESNQVGVGDQIRLNIQVTALKEELLKLFMEQPKVAKDTFSRMMREDGVEETAKYVSIFGQIVVFELLSDPTLQRDLYELSEFYHRSHYEFSIEDEYDLLSHLKTRVTASEIRVLTQKSSEKFDFLTKIDAGQIFNLIRDEKVQVQSIVLTQLDRKKRTAVFEMYQGQAKVRLLTELSAADAIPKEYMLNVAQALQKKVNSSPEFDTENLRSSDILLDLLERSSLSEQKKLMKTLQGNNAETARSLKMKLVTIEILPYLKDGHLLEVILGMDRDMLLMFLGSCDDKFRDLLIHKAPGELSESWMEDLEMMGAVDDTNARLAVMNVTGRIRNLANNGVISLLDLNEMIFSQPDYDDERGTPMQAVNTGFVAA